MTLRVRSRCLLVIPPLTLVSMLVGIPAWASSSAAPGGLAPAGAAWFDVAYPTAAATPPPAPGVADGQLVVEGVTLPTALLPVPLPGAAAAPVVVPKAVTALTFQIPAGAMPSSLVLDVASGASTAPVGTKAPTGVTPQACPATGTFAAGRQPYDQVPAHDCTGRTSNGAVSSDGKHVVFADIGALAKGKVLSIVIRPGTAGADRLVFEAAKAGALALLPFDAAPAFTPSGGERPPAPAPAVASPSAVPGGTGVGAPTGGGALLPGGAVPMAQAQAAGPPPAAAAAAAASPSFAGAASSLPDDGRTRALALAGFTLLTALVAWLMLTDSRNQLLASWRALQALRAGLPVPAIEPEQWGYGRHRSVRSGHVPRL